jgi:hypothetical protein
VVRFYAEHGYDFVVLTDHNKVTEPPAGAPILVLPGIELTHNPGTCDPPPPRPKGGCRIHVNGLLVTDPAPAALPWKETSSARRVDMYEAAFARVRALGAVAMINHPRWHYGLDGAHLAELARRGVVLFEIGNQGLARWDAADGDQPSGEAVWDAALAEGVTLWGVATDDAHHYYDVDRARAAGGPVYPAGRGFVMVRAERDPAAIRAALTAGDFYASTGPLLAEAGASGGDLVVVLADASPGDHRLDVVGAGGRLLHTATGRSLRFRLSGAPPGAVRAVVTDERGGKAWVQPIRVP